MANQLSPVRTGTPSSPTTEALTTVESAQHRILSVLQEFPQLRDYASQKMSMIAAELEHLASTYVPGSPLTPGGASFSAIIKNVNLNGTRKSSDNESPNSQGTPQGSEVDTITRLKKGFRRFKAEYFLKEAELFNRLARVQTPKVLVVGCCDSRVSPDTVMGLAPGELFTVRCIANLIPPWEKNRGRYHGISAALEYAVLSLKIEHIIVLGHRRCGGIAALMKRKDEQKTTDFIDDWMEIAASAKQRTLHHCANQSFEEQCKFCEKESINCSLANLLTFPWVNDAISMGRLQLHGWYYDFVEGSMSTWSMQLSINNFQLLN